MTQQRSPVVPRTPKPGHSLAELRPDLAAQWDVESNGDLSPAEVTVGSRQSVHWVCPEGADHRWQAPVYKRSSGGGCPFCSGRRVSVDNNLAALNPVLAAQWDVERNGDLSPADVTVGSRQSVHWACPKGADHRWQTTVNDRSSGHGCPFCAGQRVGAGNNLATLNPALAAQWDVERNGGLSPADVTVSSNKSAHWACPKGADHRWQTQVGDRSSGRGCPFCAGQRVSASNNLAALNPVLAAEWDVERNGELSPADVTVSSNKSAHWVCPEGADHRWQAQVSHRSSGDGCPFCSGRRVSVGNNLATLNPVLAAEWDVERNGDLSPVDVTVSSDKSVHWVCPKGADHRWQTAVNSRNNGNGCPFCRGLRVATSNSLASLNSALAAQWDVERNGGLTPADVTAGSNKVVHWACPKGADHRWQTTVNSRSSGSGCPICSHGWSLKHALAYLRDKNVEQMSPSQRYAVFAQTQGLMESKHRQTILNVLSGSVKLIDLIESGEDFEVTPDEPTPDSSGNCTLEEGADPSDHDDGIDVDGDLIEGESGELDTPVIDVIDLAGDLSPDYEPSLPALTAAQVLDQGAAALVALADGDSETVAYLIADDVAELWKIAYTEDIRLTT